MPINTASVDIILLDFGGVLFEITSTQDWLDHHISPLLGTDPDMPAFEKLYHASECGELSDWELKASMEDLSGRTFSMEAFTAAWNGILLDMPESSISIVHRLAERYDLYLLSNTNSIHYAAWWKTIEDKFGAGTFAHAFRGFFYSHELGCIKPAREIYRKVHDLLGSPSKSSVLFFDDKKENTDAAEAFGWQACHVDLPGTDLTALVKKLDLLG